MSPQRAGTMHGQLVGCGLGRRVGGDSRGGGFLGVFVALHDFNSTPFRDTPENSHTNTYLH